MVLLLDGKGTWWKVDENPSDLISFPVIKDWTKVSKVHRAERDKLNEILPRFNNHALEHNEP